MRLLSRPAPEEIIFVVIAIVALFLSGAFSSGGTDLGGESGPIDKGTATPISGAASPTASLTSSPTVSPTAWTVIKIIDGDTFDVRSTAGTEERVRVIGIDTPERGECGFTEASTALSQITLNQQVSLVAGARDDRDRYNRLLRYLDVGSTDAGLKLIEGGFAIARYDSRDGYGRHSREDVYVAADAAAVHLCGVGSPTFSPTVSPPARPSASPSLSIGVRTGLPLLYDPFGSDRNCGDFASWSQAQDFFEAGPANDPHRLDADNDGYACESLPGAP